jgi:hypothetical protein
MSGRIYAVAFSEVTVTAAQDLFGLLSTSSMAIRPVRLELGQRTLTAWEAKPLKIIINPTTVTVGSGGSAVTPQPLHGSDPAATFTARANDTTAQTTSGTARLIMARDFEFLNGALIVWTPKEDIIVRPSEGLQINLPVAPSASTAMSGTLFVEEVF